MEKTNFVVGVVLKIVGVLSLLAVLVAVPYHMWRDHQQTHFNTQMIEAIRLAVLEEHPELAATNPPDVVQEYVEAPVEEAP